MERANPIGSVKQFRKYPVIIGSSFHFSDLPCYTCGATTWSYYNMQKFAWHEREVGISLGVVGLMVGLVQGVLIRRTIPILGQEKSVYTGLFYMHGYDPICGCYARLDDVFIYRDLLLGGLAGPALQG
jgi:DHA1 family tetracycline resistance protein-like MFS transporter